MTLRERLRKVGNPKAGFTLVEILLVVVIIGILVGIALPKLSGRKREAEVAAARADIQAIGTALDLYELDNGSYPPSLQGLMADPGGTKNWRGPYLKKNLPKDPWGNDYIYSKKDTGYELTSQGPPGGEGWAAYNKN